MKNYYKIFNIYYNIIVYNIQYNSTIFKYD